MKSFFKLILSIFLTLFFISCENKIKSELNVLTNKTFQFKNENGQEFNLESGKHKIEFEIGANEFEMSYLRIVTKSGFIFDDRESISLKLPTPRKLLELQSSLILSGNTLGQPFGLEIKRTPGQRTDHFDITFFDKQNSSVILGTTSLEYSSDTAFYNADKLTFLRSFQEVKRSQRAVVFAINSDAGRMLKLEATLPKEITNHITDYAAMFYIAPWVYARYGDVTWMLGKNYSESELSQKWSGPIKNYAVIDYLSAVHSGDQFSYATPLDHLPLKKNQLRFVYTSACKSESADEFILKYNAAVAVGHRALSFSPMFSFSLIRNWTYGNTVAESVNTAYQSGKIWLYGLSAVLIAPLWEVLGGKFLGWKNTSDMLYSSELMISYTDDMTPYQLTINDSAVLNRSNNLYASNIKILEASKLQDLI